MPPLQLLGAFHTTASTEDHESWPLDLVNCWVFIGVETVRIPSVMCCPIGWPSTMVDAWVKLWFMRDLVEQ